MQKLLNILAQTISYLLYPMLMPSYGMLCFCLATKRFLPTLPNIYTIICLIGTVFFTLIIPVLLLVFLRWKGQINSLELKEASQRTIPYIYTIICYGFWAYFVHTMQLPIFMVLIAVGAIVALIAVTIINHWWKISAHLTGIGGLLGGICSFALYYSTLPFVLVVIVLTLSLLLMYARLYLNAHTPLQVVCGLLLGLLCTFTPTFIMTYA